MLLEQLLLLALGGHGSSQECSQATTTAAHTTKRSEEATEREEREKEDEQRKLRATRTCEACLFRSLRSPSFRRYRFFSSSFFSLRCLFARCCVVVIGCCWRGQTRVSERLGREYSTWDCVGWCLDWCVASWVSYGTICYSASSVWCRCTS